MSKLNELKIYDDGTMLAFAYTDDRPISSEPPGTVMILPFGTQGFSFVRLQDRTVIAEVTDFNNIYDETGTAYGATYKDVFNALNAFFDKGGGGTGAGDASAANQLTQIAELQDINAELDTQTGLLASILGKIGINPSNVSITSNLIFKPSKKLVKFQELPLGFSQKDLLLVLNASTGTVIFDPFTLGKFGTIIGKNLSLEYDTTSMSEIDVLFAYCVDNSIKIILNKVFETLDSLTKETKQQNIINNHILTS